MIKRLRRNLSKDLHTSVVRRSLLQVGLIVPGFLANFLVYYFAGRLLSKDQFGVFYGALTVSAVLFSGCLILNVFFTRHLVRMIKSEGPLSALHGIRSISEIFVKRGLPISLGVFCILLLISNYMKVHSVWIIALIVVDTYTTFICDLGRVFFQATGRSLALGLYTTGWMLLRLALCVGAMAVYPTVEAGLIGQVLPAIIIFLGFLAWIQFRLSGQGRVRFAMPSIRSLVVPAIGYGMLILASSMDVLMATAILPTQELSTYSASTVFPKAILVVITPLLQMLFPMVVGAGTHSKETLVVVGKILGVTLLLSTGAAVSVWLLSSFLCGGTWGLKFCQPETLGLLLLAAIPWATVRALVMLQFARGRERVAVLLAIPVLSYFCYCWFARPSLLGVASTYAWTAAATLGIYFVIDILSEFRLRTQAFGQA